MEILVHKKYTLTLLWDENFFLWLGRMRYKKNPSFYTDFQNMISVKSAPKKSDAQKNDFLGLSIVKLVFGQKHFLCTFY
jgi:hypothetical protein